jgi:hypothetical protein
MGQGGEVRQYLGGVILELAAIDRHAGLREQTHCATERDKAGAHLPDGAAVVLAEIGNRL